MKYLQLIIFLFYCQSIISQIDVYANKSGKTTAISQDRNKAAEYKAAAQKALSENKAEEAKNIYKKIVKIEPYNKNNWFDLATIEMYLKEKDSACEHYYKAAMQNDKEAKKITLETCSDFLIGKPMYMDQVDKRPKFIYKDKEYEIVEGKTLSPKYMDRIITAIKRSKFITSNNVEKIYMSIHINSEGIFDGKVLKISFDKDKVNTEKYNDIKQEIMDIFSNTVKYIPAKHKEKSVALVESWSVPIVIRNPSPVTPVNEFMKTSHDIVKQF